MRKSLRLCLTIATALFLLSCTDETRPAVVSEQGASQSSDAQRSELVQPEKWWRILPRSGYASLEKVGEFQGWFEVYQLLEGTYAIYEPYQFEEAISYLVLGAERGVLVDTGNGIGNIKEVVSELTQLPVSVLLTHEHHDHSGGSHLFEEVAIYNHPEAIKYLRAGLDNAGARPYITGDYVWKPLPKGVDPETWHLPSLEPTTLLEDGSIIDLGGRQLEVIYTPGHSPGSVCYLDRANRLLFTGDHFYPGPLYAHNPYTDVGGYLASYEKISERVGEYDHVLGGHNEPWVPSEVIPRVREAFQTVLGGGGEFSEDGELRRYHFDGFDIIIRAESVMRYQ
ncbi:MAG: MBL fold metallo-hydrolase [Acidobacteriota bacterium]